MLPVPDPHQTMPSAPAIEAAGLRRSFGGLVVTQGIDFALSPGARHALIGPNGAGKTTFVNLLTGSLLPDAGRILLQGVDVTRRTPEARVKQGLARTFQINSQFRSLSVLQNVCLAAAEQAGIGHVWYRRGYPRDLVDGVRALLRDLRLEHFANQVVSELPYGHQRVLEIAMALALEPNVLLLDEPAAGVPSSEVHVLLDVLDRLPADLTMLLIEHDMNIVFRFAEQITVLCQGTILTTGSPAEIQSDPRVREVYLGARHG